MTIKKIQELPNSPDCAATFPSRDLSQVLDKTVSFEQIKLIAERTERKLL